LTAALAAASGDGGGGTGVGVCANVSACANNAKLKAIGMTVGRNPYFCIRLLPGLSDETS
jgi:hypothetical protein